MTSANKPKFALPTDVTLQHAARISVTEDKPIMMDYWTGSLDGTVLIGVKKEDPKEKLLVKSEDEYTSTIKKFYQSGEEYIIVTENSIYLASNKIPTREIM
jgi:hypothetical protein